MNQTESEDYQASVSQDLLNQAQSKIKTLEQEI